MVIYYSSLNEKKNQDKNDPLINSKAITAAGSNTSFHLLDRILANVKLILSCQWNTKYGDKIMRSERNKCIWFWSTHWVVFLLPQTYNVGDRSKFWFSCFWPFGFYCSQLFENYSAFNFSTLSVYNEGFFKKRVVRTKLDIYVFIKTGTVQAHTHIYNIGFISGLFKQRAEEKISNG